MAARSHTETFVLLRNKAATHRQFARADEIETDERAKLVGNGDVRYTTVELDDEEDSSGALPPWVNLVDEFRYECTRLSEKIKALKEIQEGHLKSKNALIFCDSEGVEDTTSCQEDIEQRSQEISRMFSRMHSIIQETKGYQAANPNSKLLRNVLQWQYREISNHSQTYRQNQREYLAQRQAREKYKEQFIINFEEEFDKSTSTRPEAARQIYDVADVGDEELNVSYDSHRFNGLGQQQQLLQQDFLETEMLRERDAELNSIVKSIYDLNQVFQEINTMVVNQGSLLDRIDYNIETVQIKVEQGAIQLAKAERSARSARKMKCILAMAGSLLLTLLILIIQS